MLRALWQLLRPGGALLYMTCSLLRAENDTPVSAFVREHGQTRRPGSGSAGYCTRGSRRPPACARWPVRPQIDRHG